MKSVTEIFSIFFTAIESISPFEENDKNLCLKYFEPVTFKKGEYLVKVGETPPYFYFIVSGLVRKFTYDNEGNEITIDFSHNPGVFNCYDAFIDQKPCKEYMDALTDCVILRITYKNFVSLMDESEAAKQYTIKLLQIILKKSQERVYDMGYTSAAERYKKFVEKNPYIANHANLMHISTYIGVRPQSLSRIRGRKMKVG